MRALAVAARFSKSRASLRFRLIQARVRSTIQRLASTTKPVRSERLMISMRQWPERRAVWRTRGPWYPASAKIVVTNGKRRRTALVRTSAAPSRSWTLAAWTTAASRRPWWSVRIWRLIPLIFLPASNPTGSIERPLFASTWCSGCREEQPRGWLRGLPVRAPRHRVRRGYAPACRPRPTTRNSCALCSWAENPWAGVATDSRSPGRRATRRSPHGCRPRAGDRRVSLAGSAVQGSPIRWLSDHSDNRSLDRSYRARLSFVHIWCPPPTPGTRYRITTAPPDSTSFRTGSEVLLVILLNDCYSIN